ncbi:hypothetical protein GLAREA_10909 [Glarea lozoyensis ATCC 20868]|uniref:Allergen n=2 Tax=Glarea lozoyensis TaxID=101852 RepID=S3D9R7_GLAL2|nr:uncharacterized protein GLAREA_10909 [Glarea lozoyensis ATCC 20868]EHK96035.1 hypothetical protein M7I_8279 [Glarea lozoyensis 74030]EPE35212.1 hypothetical protein GLAREA_10909 [Glarea lozoyensis ATCC 20868]
MDKAKQAVSGFLAKDGKHDTTVHETINPAVVNEHVTRTQLNEQQTAIDREVHQDHYHTSVQPVQDREVLPEQHTHQMAGVEHREIKHGNDDHVKQRLAAEAAQFKNTREVGEVQTQTAAGATVAGEHVHHHVHENIQPVIQKETIQPSVVHTTVPIHEVHQNEAKHHTATQLPAVSLSEFKSQGGHLGGREERTDAFQGEPRSVGGTLGGKGAHGTTSLTEEGAGRHGHSSTTGPHSSSAMNKADPRVDSDLDGSRTVGQTGSSNYTTSGAQNPSSGIGSTSTAPRTTGTGVGHTTSNTTHGSHGSETKHKPSLMDKLNPKVDADGDGKAGFMK